MSHKKYRMWQAVIGIIVGGIVGVSIALENWIITIVAIAIGMCMSIILRRYVKGIVADERTYAAANKASRFAVSVVGLGMAIIGGILLAVNYGNLSSPPAQVGFTLLYASCALVVINSLAYTYYNHKLGGRE